MFNKRVISKRNKVRKLTSKRITKRNVKKNKKKTKKIFGGDVFNHLFCRNGSANNPRPSLHPEDYPDENDSSVALEYYNSVHEPFEVCQENLPILLEFKKSNFKWFKFLIFIINGETYVYAIDGFPKKNKHPICYLFGIINKTNANEYIELKKAFETVKNMKEQNVQVVNEYTPEIIELNSQIIANLSCMKVKSAGSGTVLENNTICINNKSGHFKAKFEDIEPYAREIFAQKTMLRVTTTRAPDKAKIINFLNDNGMNSKLVNRYSGLCL